MASNSLEDVLAWLEEETRLLGWGFIFSLEWRKVNLFIAQQFINNFHVGNQLEPVNGEVELIENDTIEMLHNFILDAPLLSFDDPDLNNSLAKLSMPLVGGNQVTVKKEGSHWKPYRINVLDPNQGPVLTLVLKLVEVPGVVDGDNRVRLDLSKSDDFMFTAVGMAEAEKRKLGTLFKDTFNGWDDEKRVFTLGTIHAGLNELMKPHSFELRTQASPKNTYLKSDEAKGAILTLVRMLRREGGNYPGAGYKYLIPEDPVGDYSATLLFERKRIASLAMLEAIETLIDSKEFTYEFDDKDNLIRASSKSGQLTVGAFWHPVLMGDKMCTMNVPEQVFLADESQPLVIDFSSEGTYTVQWAPTVITPCEFSAEGEETITRDVRCAVVLTTVYELVEDVDKRISLERRTFSAPVSMRLVAEQDADNGSPVFWTAVMVAAIIGLVLVAVFQGLLQGFFHQSFAVMLNANIALNKFVDRVVTLYFGQAIQGDETYVRHDIGYFGRINPRLTSFVISPLRPLMAPGSTLQFAVDPPVEGLEWSVHDLVPGVRTHRSLGSIDKNGLYTAPPMSPSDGPFIRLRVRATDPSSEYESTALVSVVASGVTVNPLIQVCGVGSNVELAAGALEEGELSWSIKNPSQWSGSIEPSVEEGGDHTYRHGPVSADPDLTFVLDEIEVKSRSGLIGTAHVLALNKVPFGTVNIISMDAKTGKVEFELTVNSIPQIATWSIPFGKPEQIVGTDMKAVYTVDDTSSRYYELIFGMIDTVFGRAEGYFILPLPLSDFPTLSSKLLEKTN